MNWDEIEGKYGGNHYADIGKHTVKCTELEIKEVGSKGSVIQKFSFEGEDGTKYPTADHWLSFKNDNWRAYHELQLLLVLGADKEKAKKAIEIAEKSSSKEEKIKCYQKAFDVLLQKQPTVEIEIIEEDHDGKSFKVADFADRSVNMLHGSEKKSNNVLADAEDVSDDISISLDSPF